MEKALRQAENSNCNCSTDTALTSYNPRLYQLCQIVDFFRTIVSPQIYQTLTTIHSISKMSIASTTKHGIFSSSIYLFVKKLREVAKSNDTRKIHTYQSKKRQVTVIHSCKDTWVLLHCRHARSFSSQENPCTVLRSFNMNKLQQNFSDTWRTLPFFEIHP